MHAGKWQIFAKDFAKEWVQYPFNPIALASITIAKELIFCNAIADGQCEQNLRDFVRSTGIVPGKAKDDSVGGLVNNFGNVDII